jgi:hypothetical protein
MAAALAAASAGCGPQKKFCAQVLNGQPCPDMGFDSGIHPDTGGMTGSLDGPPNFIDTGTTGGGGTGGAPADASSGN